MKDPAPWRSICDATDLLPGAGRYVVHQGRALAVFRLSDGSVRVIDDACPHAGGSLSAGRVDEASLCAVCPWHGWPFSLNDGRCPDNPAYAVTRYEVKIEAGKVWISDPNQPPMDADQRR